jgi:protoheme IX farnesyltransferase
VNQDLAVNADRPWGKETARPPLAVARALIALTKPRIIELLLITTVPTMMLAAGGLPSGWLVLATLAGGSLAAGSANTINCYLDRDIDALMKRTSHRPLVNQQGTIKPAEALAWGLALGVGATALLGLAANWLAAALADAAILFYVLVYTLLLKRRSPSNIVIGGAAGCFPVLVGWAAVKGMVAIPAVVLFAVIFLWTPPHFWALAMKYRDDYARASVPMLPVVASPQRVTRKIVIYSCAMVAATLGLAPYAGWIYTLMAAGLGAWFMAEACRLHGRAATADATAGALPALAPMRLFHLSITYLTLLFTTIAVCALLPVGSWLHRFSLVSCQVPCQGAVMISLPASRWPAAARMPGRSAGRCPGPSPAAAPPAPGRATCSGAAGGSCQRCAGCRWRRRRARPRR